MPRFRKNEDGESCMKICTVNIPTAYIDAIEKLVGGERGLYPSRSELVRCAVRQFLIKELKMAKNMAKYDEPEFEEVFDDDKNFVRVPTKDLKDVDYNLKKVPKKIDESMPTYTFTCPNCNKKTYRNVMNGVCPKCNYPKHESKNTKEPVREFKTYRILKRLEL